MPRLLHDCRPIHRRPPSARRRTCSARMPRSRSSRCCFTTGHSTASTSTAGQRPYSQRQPRSCPASRGRRPARSSQRRETSSSRGCPGSSHRASLSLRRRRRNMTARAARLRRKRVPNSTTTSARCSHRRKRARFGSACRTRAATTSRTARRCAACTSCRSSRGSGATRRRAFGARSRPRASRSARRSPQRHPPRRPRCVPVARRDAAHERRGRRTRDVTSRARVRRVTSRERARRHMKARGTIMTSLSGSARARRRRRPSSGVSRPPRGVLGRAVRLSALRGRAEGRARQEGRRHRQEDRRCGDGADGRGARAQRAADGGEPPSGVSHLARRDG